MEQETKYWRDKWLELLKEVEVLRQQVTIKPAIKTKKILRIKKKETD